MKRVATEAPAPAPGLRPKLNDVPAVHCTTIWLVASTLVERTPWLLKLRLPAELIWHAAWMVICTVKSVVVDVCAKLDTGAKVNTESDRM